MKTFRIRHVLTALAIAALLLPATAAVDAQSKGTIKIASQSPLSGGQAALGEGIKLGAQLAVEKLKGNLEKMGYKVEFVPFDDQAKPDVGVANAKNIIADKDIMAVIGHLNSGVAIPSSEVYKEVGVVMISPANTNPVVTDRGYPNVNRVCGRDDVQGVVGSEFAHGTMKVKSAAIVHDKTQYGQSIAEFFKADAEKKGIKVVAFEGTEEKSNFDSDPHAHQGQEPRRHLLRRHLRPGRALLQAGAREGHQGQVHGPGRHGLLRPDQDRRQGGRGHELHLGGRAGLGAAQGQGVRGRLQEEVQQESRAVRGRGLRRGHHRHEGHRGGRQEGQGHPRGRLDRGPQGQALRHHGRHRVRREGRPR